MNILILTEAFPPVQGVAARRWGFLCRNLVARGHFVSILTRDQCFDVRYDEKTGISILSLPVVGGSTLGWESAARRSLVKSTVRSGLRCVAGPMLDRTAIPWLAGAKRHLPHLYGLANPADVIISSYGPSGPLWLGFFLSRKLRKAWVVDVRDSFDARRGCTYKTMGWVNVQFEKLLLSKANLRLTVSDRLARYLGERYGSRFVCIYNGWAESDRILGSTPEKGSGNILYYAGTIYPHQTDAWDLLMEAIRTLRQWRIKVRLLKGDREMLLQKAAQKEVGNKVEILSAVDSAAVRAELADATAALVLEDVYLRRGAWSAGTVTGKLIALLASSKPGVAIASRESEIYELASRVSGWQVVDSVADCRAALVDLANRRVHDVLQSSIEDLRTDKQAAVLEDALRKVLFGQE